MTATDSWAAAGEPAGEIRDWLEGVFQGKDETVGPEEGIGNSSGTQGENEVSSTGSTEETVSSEGMGDTEETGDTEEAGNTEGTGDTDGPGLSQEGTQEASASEGENPEGTEAADETQESGGETEPSADVTYRNPEDVVYTTVEDDYFSDAVFIGDSRMVGMHDYGGMEDISTFYVSKGLTIFKIFTAEIADAPDGGKITVEQALTENRFAKIYLEVGINEMGTGDLERFLNTYQDVVDHLQELQPDAIIYLQAIMKVTTERSNKGDYINNQGIEDRNAGIAAIADNIKTYYLDVNPLVVDEDGGLNPDYTYDGVHLKGKHVVIWKDFLKEHAVVLD